MQESNPEFTRNQREIEELIDNLQNFHCELFDVFKGSMMYLKLISNKAYFSPFARYSLMTQEVKAITYLADN